MQNRVTELLDQSPLRWRQWSIVSMVMLTLIIDGVDIQLLSLVTPLILAEWLVSKAAFGWAMGAALIGMSLGASIGGVLGDRLGRKTVLIGSTLLFGVMTIAASTSHNIPGMVVFRFVAGIGFGAATPNGMALASEWLPMRARSRVAGSYSATPPLGGIIGAGATLLMLPSIGWRGCFIAFGVLALIIAVMMVVVLPESASFLATHGKRKKAERLLRRILAAPVELEPSDGVSGAAPAVAANETGKRPAGIFVSEFRRLNYGVWGGFLCVNLIAYSIAAWTPVYLTMSHFTLPQAIQTVFVHNIAAVTGAAIGSLLVVRFGSRNLLLICCGGTLASIVLLALTLALAHGSAAPSTRLLVTLGCAGVGAFNGGALATVYALLTYAYPTTCRGTGIGFGLTMGRLGGITATLTGGFILSLDGRNTLPYFVVLGACAIGGAIGASVVDRHIPAGGPRRRAATA